MLLSIIIPVYNVQDYLEECIESILAQTLTDWELLLIDDGSTDSSGKICDKFAAADSRIKVCHIDNGGQARARNLALEIAKGDYITFIDSDDYLLEGETLTKAIGVLREDPSCDIVQFPSYKLENNILTPTTETIPESFHSAREYIENLDMATCRKNLTIFGGACTKIFNRELFETIRFPEGIFYEDTYLLCDIFDISKGIKIISDGGYVYRIRSGSTTNRGPQERYYLDRLTMQMRVHNSLMKHSPNRRIKTEFVYEMANCFAFARKEFGSSERYDKLLNEFANTLPNLLPFWSWQTVIKSTIIFLFGVKGWVKLKAACW